MRYPHKGIVVDTGAFISDECGRFDLWGWMLGDPPVSYVMSSITAAELLAGVEHAEGTPYFPKQWQTVEDYLATFPVLNFDLACARRWAPLSAELGKRGLPIGPHDLLIAATALVHGYAVATFNVREFSRVPGLSVTALG